MWRNSAWIEHRVYWPSQRLHLKASSSECHSIRKEGQAGAQQAHRTLFSLQYQAPLRPISFSWILRGIRCPDWLPSALSNDEWIQSRRPQWLRSPQKILQSTECLAWQSAWYSQSQHRSASMASTFYAACKVLTPFLTQTRHRCASLHLGRRIKGLSATRLGQLAGCFRDFFVSKGALWATLDKNFLEGSLGWRGLPSQRESSDELLQLQRVPACCWAWPRRTHRTGTLPSPSLAYHSVLSRESLSTRVTLRASGKHQVTGLWQRDSRTVPLHCSCTLF